MSGRRILAHEILDAAHELGTYNPTPEGYIDDHRAIAERHRAAGPRCDACGEPVSSLVVHDLLWRGRRSGLAIGWVLGTLGGAWGAWIFGGMQ